MSEEENIISAYNMKELGIFLDCPLKWHIIKNTSQISPNPEREKIQGIIKFFLYRLTRGKSCPSTSLINRLKHKTLNQKELDKYTNWILSLQKKFSSFGPDIIGFNYPFCLRLLDKIDLSGTIDIIIKSTYGGDIIIYDFDENPEEGNYIDNPLYTLYIMAFEHDFKKDINAIKVYNFPTSELIDISRSTKKMMNQLDIIKLKLIEMNTKDILPKISLRCHTCEVANECTQNEVDF